jgi:chromosome segregation ATPase
MICPKCGLEQEERRDCRKCGIVFSKYFALFSSNQNAVPKGEVDLLAQEFPDLHQKLRELNARFVEIEFEKAERNRLRTDLRDLESRFQQNQDKLEAMINQIESRLASAPEAPGSNYDEQMRQILPKCEACENKTAKLVDSFSLTVNQLGDLWENTNRNSRQLSELQDQVAEIRKEVWEIKEQFAHFHQALNREEPKTINDDNIQAIRKNLDELGQFISSLSRRP